MQPRAGRLDLLLQDADSHRRFEVELQLGASDESHIIRTIEYWDVERKRYPQYEHTAVLVAEDITSRFLNVINLFNGMIPLIAIQMRALRVGTQVGLVFTTVVNQLSLGLDDGDGDDEPTDRAYWEARSNKKTMAMLDQLLQMAQSRDPKLELKYNKFYVGLARHGQPYNFLIFRPKKGFLRIEPRLPDTPTTRERLESAGLDLMEYDVRWGRYRIRLQPGDIEKHNSLLQSLVSEAQAVDANE